LGFQLWVNLPAAQKMSPPRYQEINAASIPALESDGVRVRVAAGEYRGVRGPVTEINAQPLYMDVTLQAGAEFDLPILPGHTVLAYLFEGEGRFGPDEPGQAEFIPAIHMLTFEEGDRFRARGGEKDGARFMLMAGAPFREPIFPYGPFVMNTQEEIQQGLEDLRNGTFVQSVG
jgi:hypothetical protein